MDLDLSTFEPFMGEAPYRVLSRHPYDQFVAFQVMAEHPQTGHRTEFSALWDSYNDPNISRQKLIGL